MTVVEQTTVLEMRGEGKGLESAPADVHSLHFAISIDEPHLIGRSPRDVLHTRCHHPMFGIEECCLSRRKVIEHEPQLGTDHHLPRRFVPIEGCHTLNNGTRSIGPTQRDTCTSRNAAHSCLGGHPHVAHAVDGQFEHTIVGKAIGHADMTRCGVTDGPRRTDQQEAGHEEGCKPSEHGDVYLRKGLTVGSGPR